MPGADQPRGEKIVLNQGQNNSLLKKLLKKNHITGQHSRYLTALKLSLNF